MGFFRLSSSRALLLALVFSPSALVVVVMSFSPPSWSTSSTSQAVAAATTQPDAETMETRSVVKTVAVAGATGRTGRLVVEKLLDRGVEKVVALVRDTKRANEVLVDSTDAASDDNLEIVQCDLSQPQQIQQALQKVDAAIWCATGFSDANADPFEKIKRLLGIALKPKQSIDAIGLPAMVDALAAAVKKQEKVNGDSSSSSSSFALPKIVMCSSAGVTRPAWSDAKKERFVGAADIPIVRLNPFGILDIKRESEQKLRSTCQANSIPYSIIRPAGLNDKWPPGSRPIFSQGDVAVGRIHRQDVATLLVDALTAPEAVDKTVEVVALAGYPPAVSMRTALSRLLPDAEAMTMDEETVAINYNLLQQLLPGEQQDSAGLAMGQTYEELDQGKTGRLGPRGKEDAEAAAQNLRSK